MVIQAKRTASFSESALDRINTTISDIFNLENELSDFSSIYNTDIIEKINKFRSTYVDLAGRHPQLTIKYVYASKGSKGNISSGVDNRVKILKETYNSGKFSWSYIAKQTLEVYKKAVSELKQ